MIVNGGTNPMQHQKLTTAVETARTRGGAPTQGGAEVDQHVASVAGLLDLVLTAQKHRGITKAKVAEEHKVHGSNISAFVKSGGGVRNVSLLVVERILHSLGMHPDGVLTHGLHRWDLAGELASADAFSNVLEANSNRAAGAAGMPTWVQLPRGKAKTQHAFVAFRPCEVTLFLARVRADTREALQSRLRSPLRTKVLDAAGASELITCWQMTSHEWVVERAVAQLLDWPITGHGLGIDNKGSVSS